MATAQSSKKQTSSESATAKSKAKKSIGKPISLYPMSEEEAVSRLLRVPPPEKDGKRRQEG